MTIQDPHKTEGLFLFNKPEDISSAGYLNSIKRILKSPAPIGHGGTLDPFAEGLLIVGIGRQYTRSLQYYLKGTDKTYETTIILGASSTTYDKTGIISHFPGVHEYSDESVREALKELKTRKEQTPPPYSAKKIGGMPAYRLARQGRPFMLRPQPALLHQCEVIGIEPVESLTKVDLRIKVSSGFYVRSLAHDLGELLGSDGYVEQLVRTGIGYFKLEEALSLRDLQEDIELIYRAKGDVQGIGFRAFAKKQADTMGLSGHARNMKEGGVEILAQGPAHVLSVFLTHIKHGPADAHVQVWQDYFRKITSKKEDFEILQSPQKEAEQTN